MFSGARAWALCLLPFVLALQPVQNVQATDGPFAGAMQSAARARHVPLALIEATAYVNTSWEWIGTPALNGGVGPMNVTPSQIGLASSLSGHSAEAIKTDLGDNIDAGAALLAHYHASGNDLDSWQTAVTTVQGAFVANEIFAVLRTGASRTTSTGEAITLAPQTLAPTTKLGAPTVSGATSAAETGGVAGVAPALTTSPDYSAATWIPADPSNYSVADRAHDYPIDMIVIHDIEGSYGSAIQMFQTPGFAASAHYVVSYKGQVAQMVLEKDIAWHAGNWDYNTRSIGIEHEGFAWTPGLYTTTEYNASAQIAASICSRWGVPMDRQHVIGHNQVPDPNNPNLFGGSEHHTDPGPYWNWTYYMAQAQADAKLLPSPPHLMPDPVAVSGGATSATVTWTPARTCRAADRPITGYTVVAQPGGATFNLPATATSATFSGLTYGSSYSFTVTATNADGQDAATSNTVVVGSCNDVRVSVNPASPQLSGTSVVINASATGCPNPTYHFNVLAPGASSYQLLQDYSSKATATWATSGLAPGTYRFSVWAKDANSPGTQGNSAGRWDTYDNDTTYALTSDPCSGVTVTVSPSSPASLGTTVNVTAHATGCPHPLYHFAVIAPGATSYTTAQDYSPSATFAWPTNGLAVGTYRFSVWVRDSSSIGTAGNSAGRWDAYNNGVTYSLTACSGVTVSASPASPALVGTAVTLNAHASGCSNPMFHFAILAPGSSTYQVVQDYSTNSTFRWDTSTVSAGTYRFSVWVRAAGSAGTSGNSSGRWDAYNNGLTYTLKSSPCSAVSVSVSPASPSSVGTTVTITAHASGCPNPLYHFSVMAPGSTTYQALGTYSSSATYTWVTTGLTAGSYRFSVWARDSSSPGISGNSAGRWDAYNNNTTYLLK